MILYKRLKEIKVCSINYHKTNKVFSKYVNNKRNKVKTYEDKGVD